jgi:hypothetical protein
MVKIKVVLFEGCFKHLFSELKINSQRNCHQIRVKEKKTGIICAKDKD